MNNAYRYIWSVWTIQLKVEPCKACSESVSENIFSSFLLHSDGDLSSGRVIRPMMDD